MTPEELDKRLVTGMARAAVDALVPHCKAHPALIAFLFNQAGSSTAPKNVKAAYLLRHLTEADGRFLMPYRSKVISTLEGAHHGGIRRDMLKAVLNAKDPDLNDELADRAFHYLRSPSEPAAVKYYSMILLEDVCKRWPELGPEVIEHLNAILGLVTANFDRNAHKVIARLSKTS